MLPALLVFYATMALGLAVSILAACGRLWRASGDPGPDWRGDVAVPNPPSYAPGGGPSRWLPPEPSPEARSLPRATRSAR